MYVCNHIAIAGSIYPMMSKKGGNIIQVIDSAPNEFISVSADASTSLN